jgi:hypothetical protein
VQAIEDSNVHKRETKNLLKTLELPATKPLKLMLNNREKKVYAMVQRLNTLKNNKASLVLNRIAKAAKGEERG